MKHLPLYARRLLLAAGALSFTLPLPLRELAAQGPGVLDAFAARKDSPSDPLFGGIGLTGYSGMFGLRVSGGLNFNKSDNNQGTFAAPQYYRCDRFQCRGSRPPRSGYDSGLGIGIGGWSADADLLLAPFRAFPVATALLLGFSPYAF